MPPADRQVAEGRPTSRRPGEACLAGLLPGATPPRASRRSSKQRPTRAKCGAASSRTTCCERSPASASPPTMPPDHARRRSTRSSMGHATASAGTPPRGSDDSRARRSNPGPGGLVEVLDHPGRLCRAPSQPLLRQCLDAGMSIPTNNPIQPKCPAASSAAGKRPGSSGPADGLGDRPGRDALLRDRVIPRPGRPLLEREPVDGRGVEHGAPRASG